ncbi:MAG TPA: VWA domain-containing protein [Terriglobia bacterium]|nr:VWA domain-containing protein [Terriglobia bacterium]
MTIRAEPLNSSAVPRCGKKFRLARGLWLSFCLAPALAFGQTPNQPAATIAKEVTVVNVLATVRNKRGEIIRSLTKDDFQLQEDGRPQTIRYFSRESDLPLTLGVLVDTSLSQRRVLSQKCSASATFLDQVLRVDKDLAFIIHFDREVELQQDVTSSRQKLQSALNDLQEPQFAQANSDDPQDSQQGGSHRRGRSGGGTLLYDAVYLASNEVMAKQQGRKAILVLSDGVDRGSKETLANAIESAQRANTLVYSILFSDRDESGNAGGWGRPGMGGMGGMGRHGGRGRYPQQTLPDGKKILQQLSKETGGQLFEVSKKEALDQIYDRIQEGLRNQYSLGYTPDRAASGSGYHKISLTTSQKGLIVQARDGYYSDR